MDIDLEQLTAESQMLAQLLFAKCPELVQYAEMVKRSSSDKYDLRVVVPSPTGTKNLTVVVWMEGGYEPSLGFGPWHTHGSSLMYESPFHHIVDLADKILADQTCFYRDKDETKRVLHVINHLDTYALIELLTDPTSSGHGRITTWSGKGDREVSMDQFTLEDIDSAFALWLERIMRV